MSSPSPPTSSLSTLLWILFYVAVAAVLAWAIKARRRSYAAHLRELADERVCPHLRPAYDLLLSRGHAPLNVGQRHPDLPLEIHLAPLFDPKALLDELKLQPPVFVSERNVLFCKDDLCELHPVPP